MNKTKKKSCIHDGHRKRMRETIIKAGLKNLDEIKILEFILTLAIPRGDVNTTAHLLLNEFKSISNILNADPLSLQKVSGIGKSAAEILTILPQIVEFYNLDKAKNEICFRNIADLAKYSQSLFENKTSECVYAILLKKDHATLAHTQLINNGDIASVKFDLLDLTKLLITKNATAIAFVHNHPNGNCTPSSADVDASLRLKTFVESFGMFFVDSLIIGKDDYFSFKLNQSYRF